MRKPALLTACLFTLVNAYSQQESSLEQGEKQYSDENYTEALSLFQKAQTEEPANARVPYLIAHVYMDMNNYQQSVIYFEKAIAMDSTRNSWMYECGLAYSSIPDYKKSLQYIELAGSKGYKRTTDYQTNLASAYVNTKQYSKAVDLFKEVLVKKPFDQEILFQLAQAYFNQASYDDAIATWNKLIEVDKNNAEALYMVGICYQKKGETDKGRQLCDKAIQMDPSLASKKRTFGGAL